MIMAIGAGVTGESPGSTTIDDVTVINNRYQPEGPVPATGGRPMSTGQKRFGW